MVFILSNLSTFAQLDTLHYLPPIKPQINSSTFTQSEVILSTPSTTTISVDVTLGNGTPIAGSPFSVVQGAPTIIAMPDNANDIILANSDAGVVLSNKGYILSSADEFLVTFKGKSDNNQQADVFTCKGTSAMGTAFRWGGFTVTNNARNSYMTFMATEDNTFVNISGYNPNCTFRQGLVPNAITANALTINLNAGESYALECLSDGVNADNQDGFLGASITSNNNIVVNVGHAAGGNTFSGSFRDLLLEQTVPENILGTEYISILGNATAGTGTQSIIYEQVNVLATQDGTTISVNGGPVVATINAGDYFIIDGTNYTANGNLYIETSQPVYCFQQLRGGAVCNTVGMNLLPPLSCYLSKEVVEMPFVQRNNGLTFTGGVYILTQTGSTVLINGAPPTAAAQAVAGNTDWVTYKQTGLAGHISITSTGPMAAGIVFASGVAGGAGYYSGFEEIPDSDPLSVFLPPANTCIDTLFVMDNFDSYQWFSNGTLISSATDSLLVVGGIGNGNTYTLVTEFSGCYDTSQAIIDCPILLPAELSSFTAECFNASIDLNWTTLSETNIDHFQVEYSNDAVHFEVITSLSGAGYSTSPIHYSYHHKEWTGSEHYYRIKQVDFNGDYTYSPIIANTCSHATEHYMATMNNGTIRLSHIDQLNKVHLYDASGKLLYQGSPGELVHRIWSSGVYVLHVFSNQESKVFKLINSL